MVVLLLAEVVVEAEYTLIAVVVLYKARDCCVLFLQVYSRASRVTTAGSLFKGETKADKSSLKTLYDSFRQTIEEMTTQVLLFL